MSAVSSSSSGVVMDGVIYGMDEKEELAWLQTCPKRLPYGRKGFQGPIALLPKDHKSKGWSGRGSLLIQLREIIQRNSSLRATTAGGRLHKINYQEDGGEEGHPRSSAGYHPFSGKTIRRQGAEEFLNQLASTQPFVSLKYMDGDKYTFGNTFTSRQDQGDFVYFNLENSNHLLGQGNEDPSFIYVSSYQSAKSVSLDSPKEATYFQLDCKDEGIWITSLTMTPNPQSKGPNFSPVVSVNGVSLEDPRTSSEDPTATRESKELKFGDVVTISIMNVEGPANDGPQRKEECFADFIFTASPELQLNTGDHPGSDGGAFVTDIVVHNILDFLPTAKVKGHRLLAHTWNEEALKILQSRKNDIVLNICNFEVKDGDDDLGAGGFMQFRDLALAFHSSPLQFPHWKMTFAPKNTNEADHHRWTMMNKKILDDLTWFLETQTNVVKSLDLSGHVRSEEQAKMFQVLLVAGRESLTDLQMAGLTWSYCGEAFPGPLPQMSNLQSLSFGKEFESYSYQHTSMEPFIGWFFTRDILLNVRSLKLLASYDFPRLVLQKITSIQGAGSSELAALGDLTVEIGEYDDDDELLAALSSLRQGTLKRLVLGPIRPRGFGESLRAVLQSQTDSLEELTLHFLLKGASRFVAHVNFPQTMPKLKRLSAYFWVDPRYEDDMTYNCPPLSLSFGDDDVDEEDYRGADYPRHLPSLSSLTVWPVESSGLSECPKKDHDTSWRTFRPIARAFVGAVYDQEMGDVFIPAPAVTELDVPFRLKKQYEHVLDNLEGMFPSVVFPPKLREAREGRTWWYEDDEDEDEDSTSGSSNTSEEDDEDDE